MYQISLYNITCIHNHIYIYYVYDCVRAYTKTVAYLPFVSFCECCHGLIYCSSPCNEGPATRPNRGWTALSNDCPVHAWLANHVDHRTPSTTAAWHTHTRCLWSSNHLCLGAFRSSQVAAAQGTLELVSLWSLSQDSKGCRCESPGFPRWTPQNDSGRRACSFIFCVGNRLH